MSAMRSIPTLCSAGLRILVMIALLTMGCRTWRPGWFADRRGEPSEPAAQSPQFVDEPAVAPGPAVVGSGLGLRPGETAADRALALTAELTELRRECAHHESQWRAQLAGLEQELEETNTAIKNSQDATTEAKQRIVELQKQLDASEKTADTLKRERDKAWEDTVEFIKVLLEPSQNTKPSAGSVDSDVPTTQ